MKESYLNLMEEHKQDEKVNLFRKSYNHDQTG